VSLLNIIDGAKFIGGLLEERRIVNVC